MDLKRALRKCPGPVKNAAWLGGAVAAALPTLAANAKMSGFELHCVLAPDGQFPHARHAQIARRDLPHAFALAASGKSPRCSRAARLDEAFRPIVTTRGAGMRWTWMLGRTNVADADGEVASS